MICSLKALGLALAAVVAMSALSASASAQTAGKITPATGNVVTLDGTETGAGQNRFTWNIVEWTECPETTITGHRINWTSPKEPVPAGAEEVTLTPNFVNCQAHDSLGTHKATVTMTSCDFDAKFTETTGGVVGTYGVRSSIKCNTIGDTIDIDVYAFALSELGGIQCTIKIKAQEDLTGAHATTTLSEDFDISGEIIWIHAERSGSGCSTETTTAAQIDIDATVKGTTAGGSAVGVAVSH
jgi:hypothetical protein